MVCGMVVWFSMKFTQFRYGSLVFVGVWESGVKGGDPPVLKTDQWVEHC